MKIFISWSGDESKEIAIILKEWIPSVIQIAKPYVSSEDINKGARWASDISKELDDSSFGIICLTKSNLNAPWINFEAGALGKKVAEGLVSPFLYKIKPSEISGPILQFQSTNSDNKSDVLKLIKSINTKADFLAEDNLERAFNHWWPVLEEKLLSIKNYEEKLDNEKESNKINEIDHVANIMENILEVTRSSHQILMRSERNNNISSNVMNPEALEDLFLAYDNLVYLADRIRSGDPESVDIIDSLEVCIQKFRKPIDHFRRRKGGIVRRKSLLNIEDAS